MNLECPSGMYDSDNGHVPRPRAYETLQRETYVQFMLLIDGESFLLYSTSYCDRVLFSGSRMQKNRNGDQDSESWSHGASEERL